MCVSMEVVGFILGAFISSFINVGVEERFAPRRWLFGGRSRCESCRRDLRWWELVPVLSWVALGGKCSRCGARISPLHPLSELALGLIFSVGWRFFGSEPEKLVEYLLVAVILYLFAMYDIMHRIVPTKLVAISLVFGILRLVIIPGSPALPDDVNLISRLVGLVSLSGVFALVNVLTYSGLFPGVARGKQGFGWGDVKLSLFLGFLVGWPFVNVAFWVAVLSGALVGVVVYLNVRKRYLKLPFVPFLVTGAWVALLWGHVIMEWFNRVMFNI